MTEPSKKEEISPLCKQTFLTKDKAILCAWILGGLLLSGSGTAIGWAFATNSSIVTLEEKALGNESRLDRLDKDINTKLDILIKKSEEEHSQNKRKK